MLLHQPFEEAFHACSPTHCCLTILCRGEGLTGPPAHASRSTGEELSYTPMGMASDEDAATGGWASAVACGLTGGRLKGTNTSSGWDRLASAGIPRSLLLAVTLFMAIQIASDCVYSMICFPLLGHFLLLLS